MSNLSEAPLVFVKQAVVMRADRLMKLMRLGAPESIIATEQRMLAEAHQALSERVGHPLREIDLNCAQCGGMRQKDDDVFCERCGEEYDRNSVRIDAEIEKWVNEASDEELEDE